jgi:hypothetical protein
MTIIALSGRESSRSLAAQAITRLRSQQRADGSVPVSVALDAPSWTTALALLCWRLCSSRESATSASDRRAAEWLLSAGGKPANVHTGACQHDTSLVGWSWVAETHSWVEPTAYAVMALRAAGYADHVRVREGVRMILDRAIPSGGWNYGNSAVLGNTLRPFPETTGVALAALAGEPRHGAIDRGIAYLSGELPRIRSPLSLGWGLIGLTAWNARPADADGWLNEAYARSVSHPVNCLHDSLLLLASKSAFALRVPANQEASR